MSPRPWWILAHLYPPHQALSVYVCVWFIWFGPLKCSTERVRACERFRNRIRGLLAAQNGDCCSNDLWSAAQGYKEVPPHAASYQDKDKTKGMESKRTMPGLAKQGNYITRYHCMEGILFYGYSCAICTHSRPDIQRAWKRKYVLVTESIPHCPSQACTHILTAMSDQESRALASRLKSQAASSGLMTCWEGGLLMFDLHS